MMKPAFATSSVPLGTCHFVGCSSVTSCPRPAFAVARHGAARMMVADAADAASSLPTDSGEMVVDAPLSTLAQESSDDSATSETREGSQDSTSDTSVEASSGEESFFTTQRDLMGMVDDDDDLDVGEIITPEPPAYWRNKAVIQEAQQKFKLHETDRGSPEFQIATLTKRIEYITKHLKSNPKDFSSTRGLLKMVATRRKLLKYLKKNDSERFNNIVSGLNIRISQKLRNL